MTMLHIVTGTLVHAHTIDTLYYRKQSELTSGLKKNKTTKHTHTQRNISYFKR